MLAETVGSHGRLALRIAGWALSIAALAFFASRLLRTGLPVGWADSPAPIAATAAGAVLYAGCVALLALAWCLLLPGPRTPSARRRDVSIYLVSQFAKYLPGNVFQFAGRHMLGRHAGHGHAPLAAAAVQEILSLAGAAAGLLLLLAQPTLAGMIEGWPGLPPWLGVPFCFSLPIAWLLLWPVRRRLAWLRSISMARAIAVSLLHLSFFAGLAAVFLLLCAASGETSVPVMAATGGVAAGWLAGFVVPGAPAGLGIRETFIMLASTGAAQASGGLLLAIALLRVATLLGDLLAYLAGLALDRRLRHAAALAAAPPAAQRRAQAPR